jgi:ubiquinone/menaquinone biosynthesis C-methylase UbiE
LLITSRSAAEYRAMFGLTTAEETAASVLDCCAGGSGFAAETAARVVAVDPAYTLGRNDLADRVWAALHDGDQIIGAHAKYFDWSWYGAPAHRAELRTAAARHFLADFCEHPGRYLAAALPNLPFAADSFDLVLCSHLLFTWSDLLDARWHGRALAELIRVARHEVRVYPLVVQGTGQPVSFLDDLRAGLRAAGYRSRVQRVPYRFQKNADRMLVVETR